MTRRYIIGRSSVEGQIDLSFGIEVEDEEAARKSLMIPATRDLVLLLEEGTITVDEFVDVLHGLRFIETEHLEALKPSGTLSFSLIDYQYTIRVRN